MGCPRKSWGLSRPSSEPTRKKYLVTINSYWLLQRNEVGAYCHWFVVTLLGESTSIGEQALYAVSKKEKSQLDFFSHINLFLCLWDAIRKRWWHMHMVALSECEKRGLAKKESNDSSCRETELVCVGIGSWTQTRSWRNYSRANIAAVSRMRNPNRILSRL